MVPAPMDVSSCATRVLVKNTFLDDWEDGDYMLERQASSRANKTCPAVWLPDESYAVPSPSVAANEILCHPRTDQEALDVVSSSIQLGVEASDTVCIFGGQDRAVAVASSKAASETEHAQQDRAVRGSWKMATWKVGDNDVKHKDAPRAADQTRPPRRGDRSANRLWCHIYIDEDMQKPGFQVNKKIIGHAGNGTKRIYDATGAKIRLRGRGSGHLEGGREARVHYMLSVTCESWEAENFEQAVSMAVDLLNDVSQRYRDFCKLQRSPQPREACFWLGEASANGRPIVATLFEEQ